MLSVSVSSNASQVLSNLQSLRRDKLPLITAIALTKTSKAIEAAERAEMTRVFDRPTRWTLNGLYTRPAKPGDLRSYVGFREFAGKGTPAGKYLRYHIDGGPRLHKRFERALIAVGAMLPNQYAVPTRRAPLDEYGNVPGGFITNILSDLQASPDPFQNRAPDGGKRVYAHRLFFAVPRPFRGLAPGIYEDLSYAGRRRGTVMIFAYVRQPTYRKRFDWYGIAKRTFESEFSKQFRLAASSRSPAHAGFVRLN